MMHTTDPRGLKDEAIEAAARGWHVFPVPPGSKKSHKSEEYSGGRKWGATADPSEIARDFAHWPEANLGIKCGPDSGLFVIEADTMEGHGVDGVGNLRALIDHHGGLPHTIEAESPSGSWHIYFRWPEGVDVRNSASLVAPGVDVRGNGGMMVAPPSVKPGVGTYRWVNPPGLFDLADCPDWLLARCLKPEREREPRHDAGDPANAWCDAVLRGELTTLLSARTGDRNATLNRCAFRIGQAIDAGGLDLGDVTARLTGAAQAIGLDHAEIGPTIDSGLKAGMAEPRQPQERSDRGAATDDTRASGGDTPPPMFRPTPYVWRDPATIPPRQFLFGKHLIRQFVSMTVAPGALGKSSNMTVETLAMLTGRALLGDAPPEPLRVWSWNGEDPRDELDRRFQAACKHYGITALDIDDRYMSDSGRDVPIKLASMGKDGVKVATPTADALIEAIRANRIDVLVIDPFVTSHDVIENDTGGINAVVAEWRRIADVTGCAIELVHHTNKAASIDTDSAGIYGSRGAGALIDGVRSARYLARMTQPEADRFGIGPDERRSYFRVEDGKANLAPPEKAAWRKMIGVALDNGAGLYSAGDIVGVCTAWTPPDAFDGMTLRDLQQVQQAIDAADEPPRESEKADDWGGYIVADVLALDVGRGLKKADRTPAQNIARAKVRALLSGWTKSGALTIETIPDGRRGGEVKVLATGDPVTEADLRGAA